MKKILLFILIFIVLAFTIFSFISIFKTHTILNKTINIPRGTSIIKISSLLEENNIIKSAPMFIFLTKLLLKEYKLNYGMFYFSGKYSLLHVIKTLSQPEHLTYNITIPEGFTIFKISNVLAKKNLINYKKFITLSTDSAFISSLHLPVKNLEGFLFPDTYHIPYFADEEYIIKMMVKNFFLQWNDIQTTKLSFDSLYSTLILASIIEREAICDDERPLIAGVYKNRLKNKMLLQADPTVAYALELKGCSRKKIYYEDLKINSVYNTYIHNGLPPTPICNPGSKSIVATLFPEKTNYYFFFAGNNSRHIFSTTYKEHLKKLNKI